MSKAKPPAPAASAQADTAPPKKPNRKGKPINVWASDELHAALEQFRSKQRVPPTLTDVVELALQEFLQREGCWPPKSAVEPADS